MGNHSVTEYSENRARGDQHKGHLKTISSKFGGEKTLERPAIQLAEGGWVIVDEKLKLGMEKVDLV